VTELSSTITGLSTIYSPREACTVTVGKKSRRVTDGGEQYSVSTSRLFTLHVAFPTHTVTSSARQALFKL